MILTTAIFRRSTSVMILRSAKGERSDTNMERRALLIGWKVKLPCQMGSSKNTPSMRSVSGLISDPLSLKEYEDRVLLSFCEANPGQ